MNKQEQVGTAGASAREAWVSVRAARAAWSAAAEAEAEAEAAAAKARGAAAAAREAWSAELKGFVRTWGA